jgi:hypothetical protein
MVGFCGWPRRRRSWVFARPSPSACQSGERGEGATLWPRSLGQRVLQIACGYEDQNDSNSLREDPLLKVVCAALPESGADLASQPTLSRLENAADVRCCYRIAQAFLELYLRERAKGGAPKKVLLDFDATADPTHGEQEGSYYHGYYEQHIYHPVLVFDGQSGHLISALLSYKAEAMEQGTNPRFLVSTRTDAPEDLYEWYVRRGRARTGSRI